MTVGTALLEHLLTFLLRELLVFGERRKLFDDFVGILISRCSGQGHCQK